MVNEIKWFEIPVADMDRAIKFYSNVFSFSSMHRMKLMQVDMAFFPMDSRGAGGALCKGDWYVPAQNGIVI